MGRAGAEPLERGEEVHLSDLLGEYQRNSLVTTLRSCERNLRQAEALLSGTATQGILYAQVLDLPAAQRQRARELIAEGLALLAEIAHDFDLRLVEEDLARAIAASMTVCWANLADARSAKLRAYGEVDPRLGPALDPSLARLEELVVAVASVVQAANGG